MAGVAAEFEIEGLVDVGRVLQRLSDLDLVELADAASNHLVGSTKRRMQEDKEGPEGVPWAPWSPEYAATRHGNQSLLIAGGPETLDLQGSIASYFDGANVRIGTNVPYAAVHQFGSDDGGGIPARPYLGLSAEDRMRLERMALDLFGEALA